MFNLGDPTKTAIILSVIALIFIAIYIVLPRAVKKEKTGLLIKGLLFAGMMLYLAIDFILKEQYVILLPLGLGSWAFYKMIIERYR